MPLPNEYRGLMRSALRQGDNENKQPLKRRKTNNKGKQSSPTIGDKNRALTETEITPTPEPVRQDPKITSKNDTISKSLNEQSLEVLDVDGNITNELEDEDEDEDDEDEDIFEEIDLDTVGIKASNQVMDDVIVDLSKVAQPVDLMKKRKNNRNVIDKEERACRRQFHKAHVACMMTHGLVRNKWCNNQEIHQHLRKLVNTQIYDQLHPPKSVTLAAHRTRRLLDGLKQLMQKWVRYYKVTSNKGIYKHEWYDWNDFKRSRTDFERFKKCVIKGRGSRDIGAQGFVCLLRSVGVPTRLCYSLQPPDFTSSKIIQKTASEKSSSGGQSVKDKLLKLRKGKMSNSSERPTQGEVEQKYPIWWAEVWDSASKTWITVDPIVFQTIEIVKHKSKLEPPLTNPYNTLTYVIGYDRQCAVRDVTKRYAEKYYSKTRKKQVMKDDKDAEWFEIVINTLSQRPRNRIDEYEDEYFSKKQEIEGMPDNIQDFKSHPNYIIPTHLKSNEILMPGEEPVGMIRIRGKNEALKVFKRSAVQVLRTARAWYQRGRTLKPGERPLRTKAKTAQQMMWKEDEDEESELRLYAEYQTELYIPPPVEDGMITKNAYGNIDLYVKSMLPKGAVYLKCEFAEAAAKELGVDYARAVVGFKFEGRARATPKVDGIVVSEDIGDAVELVSKKLAEEERERERLRFEIRALKGWDLLLTKLRIRQRLNKQHGMVEENDSEFEERSESKYDEIEGEDLESHDSGRLKNKFSKAELDGGFVAEDYDEAAGGGFIDDDYDETAGGGFINDDDANDHYEYGGFVPQDALDDFDQGKEGSGEPIKGEGEDEVADALSHMIDPLPEKISENFLEGEGDYYNYNEGVDDLDEFEAFMDELEQTGDNIDEKFIYMEDQKKVDNRNDYHNENYEGFMDEVKLHSDTSDLESTKGKAPYAPIPQQAVDSEQESHFEHEADAEIKCSESPQLEIQTTQSDDEMERQIREQLKSETRVGHQDEADRDEADFQDEDFDFEYDSE